MLSRDSEWRRRIRAATLFTQTTRSQSVLTEALTDHAPVNFGILSNIQCDQVEAECIDTPQQAVYGEQSRMLALVSYKTVREQLDVGPELHKLFVREDIIVVGRLQALLDEPQEHAIRHVPVACRNGMVGILENPAIFIDLRGDLITEPYALGRLAEFCSDSCTLIEVQVKNQ